MATAGTARTWTSPEAAPELRPAHGCACDLCWDDASEARPGPAVTPRPSREWPATVTPARLVQRGRVVSIDDCDAVFGRELRVY